MKEKKYIDRLYQEKFKDFEATPNDAVWRSISAKLREKEQKKRVLTPFWSRMAGVAAILALILLIGDWMFPTQNTGNAVVNEVDDTQLIKDFIIPEFRIAFGARAKEESKAEVPAVINNQIKKVLDKKPTEVTSVGNLESNGISSVERQIISGEIEQEKSITTGEIGKKSLFEEIEKQNEQLIAEIPRRNFEVSTHAAPIYYGNFGKGNFLDSRFNNNSSEGEVTYSYGINIAYIISEKVKIRSGVNKVNMSYNTNGVSHKTLAAAAASGSGISLDINPVLIDQPVRSGAPRDQLPTTSNRASVGSLSPGFMNQKMGFIEVPVEVEYNLINKKVELNIIGGASTLFLDENRISVDAGNLSGEGKASNLNNVSFSTNIGLGIDYNLSEKFKLNLEPMLKYQLNTFDKISSENRPYYLGIYSGFSFKF